MLARLGGAIGDDVRAHAARLAALPANESRRRRAEWSARVRVPVVAGLRGVHASWIEAALAELPERARVVLAGGSGDPASGLPRTFDSAPRPLPGGRSGVQPGDDGPGPAEIARVRGVDVWLARWVTAGFVALEPTTPGPPRAPADLATVAADAALAWLAELGIDQLAIAVGDAALGPAFEAAKRRVAEPPRKGALGTQRQALERCAGLAASSFDARAIIGARTVAAHVPPLARVALALRLAKPLGEQILAALVAYARKPAPSWAALVA
ncbi:MAG TPA: hypothetical protein VH143_30595 [Kofleriaceae bacterium]|nr:hypothetical protein [Kofleriaceae bacterium]